MTAPNKDYGPVHHVFLSRRNLLTLLNKLDRVASGASSACTIVKYDDSHQRFPQSCPTIAVTAVEDELYYTDREPGPVFDAPPTQDWSK